MDIFTINWRDYYCDERMSYTPKYLSQKHEFKD